MSIDKTESGFPVFSEIIQLAADSTQAKMHLKSLPEQERLKKDMVNHILTAKSSPTSLAICAGAADLLRDAGK